jgi:ATP-dependent DNA helicase RecG
MNEHALEKIMVDFWERNYDVLVATTIVESGLDIPNANTLVVDRADACGLSQLHQLRGRVGRGHHPGICLLVTNAERDSPARERLAGVAATLDGFELARLDLEQRREGDVLGERQSGSRRTLKMLQVLRDEEVIAAARDDARELVAADPLLERHPEVAAAVAALVDEERADYLDKS